MGLIIGFEALLFGVIYGINTIWDMLSPSLIMLQVDNI